MLSLFGDKSREQYGSKSYLAVERLIKSSKDICIVSPYIDAYYADFIVRHAKGKRIRIISSAISREAKKKLSKMSVHKLILALVTLTFVNLMVFYFATFLLNSIVIASLLLFLIYLSVYAKDRSKKRGIRLKTPKEFVHMKLYIGDNMAVEGSANLTFSGMHKNIEQTRIVESSDEVSRLRKEFDSLWKRLADAELDRT